MADQKTRISVLSSVSVAVPLSKERKKTEEISQPCSELFPEKSEPSNNILLRNTESEHPSELKYVHTMQSVRESCIQDHLRI